jgi:hypothetical protein
MRVFTAAAVQIRPSHERLTAETVKVNVDHAVGFVSVASMRPGPRWWCC